MSMTTSSSSREGKRKVQRSGVVRRLVVMSITLLVFWSTAAATMKYVNGGNIVAATTNSDKISRVLSDSDNNATNATVLLPDDVDCTNDDNTTIPPSTVDDNFGSSDGTTSSPSSSGQESDQSKSKLIVTNPYYSGCLKEKLHGWPKDRLRVCRPFGRNELDPPLEELVNEEGKQVEPYCIQPKFDTFEFYKEIRIATGNWDSAIAMGWIIQIILSEILQVPTSIESGMYNSYRDFYDYNDARIDYDTSMSASPLVTATNLDTNDCRFVKQIHSNASEYIPCAHFMPEYWDYPLDEIKSQKVEPPQGIGILGLETWYITKFTADEYPEVATYNGLSIQTQTNREKLASLFKRPTTWYEYCTQISTSNCTIPDDVAQRPPMSTEEEYDRMYVENLYTGYFRYTEKNNCTLHPTNCTGHIANYPCGWTSNMESILYHLNIPLDSKNGPNSTPGGYTASQLQEMWYAANATRNNLIMMWWTPEPLYYKFLNTEAEFQRVTLKPVTVECETSRVEWRDECSLDLFTRVNPNPNSACDNPVKPLRKLIATGLHNSIYNNPNIPVAARNPAYDVLRLFHISETQLGEIFNLWHGDTSGNGDNTAATPLSPRDAVCTWVAQNINFINSTIPNTYPRTTRTMNHSTFGYVSLALSCVSTCLILFTMFMVYYKRKKPSMQFAQIDFLSILLVGSLFVGIGSILISLPKHCDNDRNDHDNESSETAIDGNNPRTNIQCLLSMWFIHLGYTIELIPLIIKVAAVNRMMSAALTMRRVAIGRSRLYYGVVNVGLLVAIYLTVWTILDPPKRVAEYTLTDDTNHISTRADSAKSGDSDDDDDSDYIYEYIVDKTYYCASSSSMNGSYSWNFIAVAWNAVLLLTASVLAFQTRNVFPNFNESRTLAFLIYSHFVFVILRICTFLLADIMNGNSVDNLRGLLYALDQIAACCIYFVPKFTANDAEFSFDDEGRSRRSSFFLSTPSRQFEAPRLPFGSSTNNNKKLNSLDNISESVSVSSPTTSWWKKKWKITTSSIEQQHNIASESSPKSARVGTQKGSLQPVVTATEGQERSPRGADNANNPGSSTGMAAATGLSLPPSLSKSEFDSSNEESHNVGNESNISQITYDDNNHTAIGDEARNSLSSLVVQHRNSEDGSH